MFVSYTQRRTETVIYSPLKSRHALLSPLVKTFLTLAVTFTSLVYLWMKIHYHVTTMECDVTWCKHSSKTDLLSIWSSAKYTHTHIEASWPPWKQTWFATFVVIMTIVGSFGHVFDGLVFRTEMSENCYTFFDAGSVVFN